MARNFMERLWFPGLLYDAEGKIAYSKPVKVGLIYIMNAPDSAYYESLIQSHSGTFDWLLKTGGCSVMCTENTLQFDDYSQYSSSMFDPEAKKEYQVTHFPKDMERAYQLGKEL